MAYFQLIRWPNVLITVATQLILIYFLLEPGGASLALEIWQVILLCTSTALITASGNVINDIYDIRIDHINKPDRIIVGKRITEKSAFTFYIILTVVAIIAGFILANSLGRPLLVSVFIITSYLLYLYASQIKSYLLAGNVLVSLLVAMVILVVGLFELYPAITEGNRTVQAYFFGLLLDYALFALMVNLIREWVKDCEDLDGDHAGGRSTLAVVLGRARAAKLIAFFACIPLFLISWYVYENLYQNDIAYLYFIFAVVMPLLYVIVKLFSAESKKSFSHLSFVLKIILLMGMLSIPVIHFSLN